MSFTKQECRMSNPGVDSRLYPLTLMLLAAFLQTIAVTQSWQPPGVNLSLGRIPFSRTDTNQMCMLLLADSSNR